MKKTLTIIIILVTNFPIIAQNKSSFWDKARNIGNSVGKIVDKISTTSTTNSATNNPQANSLKINSQERSEGFKLIHQYAELGNNEKLQEEIDKGFYVNIPTQKLVNSGLKILDDFTPLMLAAKNGHLKSCKLLMLYGADPLLKNADNKSAIDIAKEKAFAEIEKALKNKEALDIGKSGSEFLKIAEDSYRKGEFVTANSYAYAALTKTVPNTPEYLKIINSLADSYDKMAIFSKEDFFLNKALDFNEKKFGIQSNEYISSLIRLTFLYNKIAHYDKSKVLLEVLNDLSKKPNINGQLIEAKALDANGLHYFSLNDEAAARYWLRKALVLKKKLLGEDSYEYGLTLINIFKTQKNDIQGSNSFVEKKTSNDIKDGVSSLFSGVVKSHMDVVMNNPKAQSMRHSAMEKARADAIARGGNPQEIDARLDSMNRELDNKLDSKLWKADIDSSGKVLTKILYEPIFMPGRKETVFTTKSIENIVSQIKNIDGENSQNYLDGLKFLSFAYKQIKQSNLETLTNKLISQVEAKILEINYTKGLAYFPNTEFGEFSYDILFQTAPTKSLEYLIVQKNAIEKTYGKIHPYYLNVTAQLSSYYRSKNNMVNANFYEARHRLIASFLGTQYSIPEMSIEIYNALPEIEIYRNNLKHFILYWAKKNKVGISFLYDYILNDKQRLLVGYQKFRKSEGQDVLELTAGMTEQLKEVGVDFKDYMRLSPEKYAEGMLGGKVMIKNMVNQMSKSLNFDGPVEFENGEKVNPVTNKKYEWREIQATLKKGQAVVEYFYVDKSKVFTDSTAVEYYALILKPSDEIPILKYLFSQDELVGQLDYKNESNLIEIVYRGEPQKITPKKQNTTPQKMVEGKLYQLCWKEIQSSLSANDTTIFYSPSGILHKVSFCAINTPLKKPLSQKLKLNYLSSSQMLLSQNKPMKINENTSVALFANPPTNMKPLPYASEEIFKIKSILDTRKSKIEIFDKEKASESNFKTVGLQLKSPSIIHLATHGTYSKHHLAPMLRSALMFAHADTNSLKNLTLTSTDDGLLTALEASALNFNDTQLVVLSACQSGLGDFGGEEGIFGLQRAFKMAGAEYILASLWSVPDEQTSEMMNLFYNNLVKGITISKAFEMAQATMRAKYSSYYWGAFVLMK